MNSQSLDDLLSLEWRTARASGGTNCVQIARTTGGVAVRDSKYPQIVHLHDRSVWSSVANKIKDC